ncbi:phosphatidylethanolamine-binding protein-like isoform X1 [Aphis craccivora]|uniref:Phosphatidylethanolamine-binding protein-like isoform X1 n=1 Tax=Aphis craccivora TaxID=307492 RepID=A0A6G0YN83_APHCR|nr:phosphatidylethanolamine-binding protein-like isoform X1 [Aphis craccivora]
MNVNYANGKKALLGNELTPSEVKYMPLVSWNADSNSFYTLCLTGKEWHHWLVGNILGGNVSQGETLSEYIGSGPMPKTDIIMIKVSIDGSLTNNFFNLKIKITIINNVVGLNRYVFLVYQQLSIEHREKFSINKFALKYNLGTLVASNFYLAQYDDYQLLDFLSSYEIKITLTKFPCFTVKDLDNIITIFILDLDTL